MRWLPLMVCFVVIGVTLATDLHITTRAERRQRIDSAIQEAKRHAKTQTLEITGPMKFLLAFKQAPPETVKQGEARLLLEDMVRRAEKKLPKSNLQKRDNIISKEPVRVQGSTLTRRELAKIFKASECRDSLMQAPDCSLAENREFRTASGSCNNLHNPLLGAAQTPFRRLIDAEYEDGVSQLVGTMQSMESGSGVVYGPFSRPYPSVRYVSDVVVKDITEDEDIISDLLVLWGQFIDHDLDATPMFKGCPSGCEFNADRCVPVPVNQNDSFYEDGVEQQCHPFPRSIPACDDSPAGTGNLKPRQQINTISSWIDASNVYGSSQALMNKLREDGTPFLLTGENIPATGGASLPRATQDDVDLGYVGCPRGVMSGCFLAGDGRVNEQIGLTIIHTLWMREHNRIARQLQIINPHWSNDTVFEVARHIVGGEMQKITFKEYLPAVFGDSLHNQLIGDYEGYDPGVDGSVTNSFATAAFRFGHSQIRPTLERLDANFEPLPIGELQLVDAFFNPDQYEISGGTDPIIRGTLKAHAARADEFLNSDLTDHLFETNSSHGMDLATLNMQRGRDHGLPSFMTWKRWAARNDTCGLSVGSSLSYGFENEFTLSQFLMLYGSLESSDLWLGGLAEEKASGALVGPTFACILGEGFAAVRNGDRFYYENVKTLDNPDAFFTEAQRDEIEKASLSRVICDTADNITEIQPNAFRLDQTRQPCYNLSIVDLNAWAESPGGGGAVSHHHGITLLSPVVFATLAYAVSGRA